MSPLNPTTSGAGAPKGAAAPAPLPLCPPWAAFLSAGACGAVAGHVEATRATWKAVYVELGFQLPWVTEVVVEGGAAVPAALLLVAVALLAAGGWRASPAVARAARPLVAVAALLLAGGACLIPWSSALVLSNLQRQLQQ